MFIGRLAALTGCTPKAIRLYEQMGLIPKPDRQGRYRLYTAHHLTLVQLIRRAQAAGFKLVDMLALLEAKHALNAFPLALAHQTITLKRQQISAQIASLQAQDQHLVELHQVLDSRFAPEVAGGSSASACPDS